MLYHEEGGIGTELQRDSRGNHQGCCKGDWSGQVVKRTGKPSGPKNWRVAHKETSPDNNPEMVYARNLGGLEAD